MARNRNLLEREMVNEDMTALECIFYELGEYKIKNPKLYWVKEACISLAMERLRANNQHTEENLKLAEKIICERLDCSYSGK